MRTRLKRFSGDFVHSLQPLLDPLEAVLEGLSAPPFRDDVREALPVLRDVTHQFDQLVEKVENLHAFVLIFGPLKSGKSTLMNALAAAYVSEVSALPAYPCLVYVGHGKSRTFEVTRYDGSTQPVRDSAALQQMVHRDHARLTEALRAAETRGEEFDPAKQFPEALRCIDVKLPAEGLAESGAILVDTPGLYSRMKFGYDQMTKDFRNSAACAVFVVKTDNLFLEQVFDEFKELLDLFSRIFLVVNIDAAKRDLNDAGELIPSLEQRDPRRIVSAFEDFAMSMPLKRAAEEGRLQIYPIDLMHSAQQRLQKKQVDQEPGAERVRSSFDDFQNDLTEFLNSAEYLVAFMTDSIHRGETLLRELRGVLEDKPEVAALRGKLREVEATRAQADRCYKAAERLSGHDWHGEFRALRTRLRDQLGERSGTASIETSKTLAGLLERWFEADSSLGELVERDLVPVLRRHQDELVRATRAALEADIAGARTGLELSDTLVGDVREIDFATTTLASEALQETAEERRDIAIDQLLVTDEIPVRKGFLDWILFRSLGTIRRRLFGTPRPLRTILRQEKHARLGERAHEVMKAKLDERARKYLGEVRHAVEASLLDRYVSLYTVRLEESLGRRAEELSAERERCEELARSHRRVLQLFDQLTETAGHAAGALSGLRREYLADGPQLRPQPPDERATATPTTPTPTTPTPATPTRVERPS